MSKNALVIVALIAVWVVAIALIVVQNAAPVRLVFLRWQSVEIPFGVVLAFSGAVGMLGTAVVQWLAAGPKPPTQADFYEDPFDR